MTELNDINVLLLHYILFFNLGADLPKAEFLGGRFAEGRLGKGPDCPVPVTDHDLYDCSAISMSSPLPLVGFVPDTEVTPCDYTTDLLIKRTQRPHNCHQN